MRLSDPTRVDMYLGSERPRESLRVNVEVDWLDLLRGLGAEGGTVQRFAGGALIDLRKLGERELALGSAVLAVVVGSALRQGATVEVRPDVLLVLFPAGRDEFARGW